MSERAPAIERFEALVRSTRPAMGTVAVEDLVAQALAVFPLLEELPASERATGNLDSFAFRECFTAFVLLGRRLALLDLTASAVLQLAELMLAASDASADDDADWRAPRRFERRAMAAVIEGFVLGREERVAAAAEARAAKLLKPISLRDGVWALLLSGVHDASVLSECVDALGRAMLENGAETAIVDFSQLGEPNRERAAALFAAEEVARMLGGVCFFTGLDRQWRIAATEARVSFEDVQILPSVADALRILEGAAHPQHGGASPRWRSVLRRLRR